jgi:DNA integrity scanning protein DisA with diadenylate cyclase activity
MDPPKCIDMSPDADLRLSNFSNQVFRLKICCCRKEKEKKMNKTRERERERVIGALIAIKVEHLGEIFTQLNRNNKHNFW